MEITFKELRGQEINKHFEEISHLRITVFREFPYLYEGTKEYEREYLARYAAADSSLCVLACDGDRVIGATTCMSMADEDSDISKPFHNHEIPLKDIMYFGESIILGEYRGNKIGHKFFEYRENHAKEHCKNLQMTCFCAVVRPDNHPLKPETYKPLDGFWNRQGYTKQDDMIMHYPWKDVDKDVEDVKPLVFWTKKWN